MVEVLKNKMTINNFSFTPVASCSGYLILAKKDSSGVLAPIAVEILLCRVLAQKIATYSGKSS